MTSEATSQRRIHLSAPDMTPYERQALIDAFDSNWIAPVGPALDEFEEAIADRTETEAAVALSSGTAALHLGLRALGVIRGDTVIVPTLTFVASANAVRYVGAVPYFVDSEPHTGNIDPALLESTIESLVVCGRTPAAVMTVDLYGNCADYDQIRRVCRRHGIPILEDAAESLGATYRGRAAGGLGDVAAISFNGNKIVTSSGGGALVGPRPFIEQARHLATQAREEALHFEHSELGYNYRMSNLLAAVGRAQLDRLDDILEATHRINRRYVDGLSDIAGLHVMPVSGLGKGNCWLTVVELDERQHPTPHEICEALSKVHNIEARPAWKPMHLQPLYRDSEIAGGAVAERHYRRGLCLPSGSGLTDDEQDRVIEAVRAALARKRTGEPTVDLDAFDRDQKLANSAKSAQSASHASTR